jgi:2-C-methyl-D-erythritol 4-phosphate cytidylyltransferase
VSVRDVVVAAPVEMLDQAAELVPSAQVVAGGATRQESVNRALRALSADVDTVLVHDVARAFVPADVLDRVLAALRSGAQAVVPILPVTDTIRSVNGSRLGDVLDRSRLAAVQTPQGFARRALELAHQTASGEATDDASLVEMAGTPVAAVAGAPEAFKVTVPLDLRFAEAVAGRD